MIPITILMLFLPPHESLAQYGACPGGDYLMGSPNGMYPNDMVACAYNLVHTGINNNNGDFPCDQKIEIGGLFVDGHGPYVSIVPPSTTYYGQIMRVRFLFFGAPNALQAFIYPGFDLELAYVRVEYFNNLGVKESESLHPVSYYTEISTFFDDDSGFNHYYSVYLVDTILVTSDGYGGYIRARMWRPDLSDQGWEQRNNYKHALASVQIGNHLDSFPEHCAIPNANLPGQPPNPTPTPTLPPTWTPVPGATSTPTPIQIPGSTATGVVPPATWTSTPIVFPTIPAENTPTPWPSYVIPTIALPTVDFPVIDWPTADPTVLSGGVATQDASASALQTIQADIENEWATRVARSEGWADPTITNTTGFNTPSVIVQDMLQIITKPIGYLKGIQVLMPQSWIYIIFIIGIAVFVLFNLFAKFAIRLVVTIVEIVRRFWEAIPFN